MTDVFLCQNVDNIACSRWASQT